MAGKVAEISIQGGSSVDFMKLAEARLHIYREREGSKFT
jgi:hypothetical protein